MLTVGSARLVIMVSAMIPRISSITAAPKMCIRDRLLLDISGEERDAMTPEKLVDLFVRSAKQTLSDRTRLSI